MYGCQIVVKLNFGSLWELGSKPDLTPFIAPSPAKPLVNPPIPQAEAGPSRPSSPPSSINAGINDLQLDDDAESRREGTDASAETRLTPAEISTLLNLALLQSLSTTLEPASFPMPASTLYSAHILPNRPAYVPKNQREDVVIAKSEWKKLVKWMKEAGKDGLVKVKESKGEAVVQGLVLSGCSNPLNRIGSIGQG